MFILTTIADVIPIHPIDFRKTHRQALEDNINQKYANKVVQKVGLCICLYDFQSVGDGLIGQHTDGVVNVNVTFRMLVFRPFKGEIIQGTIGPSTPAGIRIDLDFFDEIHVPGPSHLFDGTHFDQTENVWVWTTSDSTVYFDRAERVRIRIEDEIWHDVAPDHRLDGGAPSGVLSTAAAAGAVGAARGVGAPGVNGATAARPGAVSEAQHGTERGEDAALGVFEREELRKERSPWRLVGSMQQGGLGQLVWW